MGTGELVGGRLRVGDGEHPWPSRYGPGDQQSVLSLHLAGLPEGETEAQLEVEEQGSLFLGMAEPQLGPCSEILETYLETKNSLPQVKMTAMIVSGEFLVSVNSGLTGVPNMGEGTVRSSRWCWKSQNKSHTKRWFSDGLEPMWSSPHWGLGQKARREQRPIGDVD